MSSNNKKKKNVIRYHRRIPFNIGVLVFALVFIYFAVYVISYAVTNHTSSYEVPYGQITESASYTGLAVRKEKVITAEKSGSLNYYKKEGDKAAYGDTVCSIDQNGDLSKRITEAGKDTSRLSQSDLKNIQNNIVSYTESYSDDSFSDVYSFKNSVNAIIQEDLYKNALKDYKKETSAALSNQTFSFMKAPESGILMYQTDGDENLTVADFKSSDYSPASYKMTNLKERTQIKKGQPAYKLITDENWHIIIPITRKDREQYKGLSVIRVTFKEDGQSSYASAKIFRSGMKYYMNLTLNSSMVRYASDRYIDLSLDRDTSSGLKIPNSSILKKKFFLIPEDYLTRKQGSSSQGVYVKGDSGKTEFKTCHIYYRNNGYYYVGMDSLSAGDQLQKKGSSQTYGVSQTASLNGVYNISKGYAVFKQVHVLARNQEYSIVQNGDDYGLTLYDHIALNANSIKEGDFIK